MQPASRCDVWGRFRTICSVTQIAGHEDGLCVSGVRLLLWCRHCRYKQSRWLLSLLSEFAQVQNGILEVLIMRPICPPQLESGSWYIPQALAHTGQPVCAKQNMLPAAGKGTRRLLQVHTCCHFKRKGVPCAHQCSNLSRLISGKMVHCNHTRSARIKSHIGAGWNFSADTGQYCVSSMAAILITSSR